MNIIFLPLLNNTTTNIFVAAIFVITHCFLSTLFFFIIDIMYKRYFSRTSVKISGVIHTTPIFGTFIFISLILFSGLPFTLKFFSEIFLYNIFLNFDLNSFLVLIFSCNLLGIIGFSKNFFNVMFGFSQATTVVNDLTKREVFIFSFIIFLLFFFLFCLNFIF